MESLGRFGTALNCMDGRVQDAVSGWLKEHFQLDYVDMITEPGMDGLLARGAPEALEPLRLKLDISFHRHHSTVVAVVGHHDCAGHPVPEAEHRADIARGLQTVRFWNLPMTVVGLWINADWEPEVVNG